jgi:hypothetical protein
VELGEACLRDFVVMTAITVLAIFSSAVYLAISWLEASAMRRR